MSKRMKAKTGFSYRGTKVAEGEVFKVKDGDIRLLSASNLGELVDETEAETQPQIVTVKEAPRVAALTTADLRSPVPANQPAPAPEPKPKAQADNEKPLASKTIPELKALAKELGVELEHGMKKADMLTKIRRSRTYQTRHMTAG